MAARRLIWIALGLAGCFSGADFADCPKGDECGNFHTCVSGECVPNFDLEPDALRLDMGQPEMGNLPDRGLDLEEIDLRQQPLSEDVEADGKRLILGRNAVTAPLITIRAAEIIIDGPIEADGVGNPAGGGGGGGSGGSQTYRAGGGPGGRNADAGQGASGLPGGRGGRGGNGIGVHAGQGGDPGTPESPDGQPGTDAVFVPGNPCDTPELFQPGNGGGGGGGGRGAAGVEIDGGGCRTGGGGGGGGAGGPGGGALAFEATARIIIRNKISARGEAASRSEAPTEINGGATCGGNSGCDEGCVDGESARGGQGSDATGPGNRGENSAGDGGAGGAGSGGMIRIQAPVIELESGTLLDVQGGARGNPGAVYLLGDVRGLSPVAEGGAPVCQLR